MNCQRVLIQHRQGQHLVHHFNDAASGIGPRRTPRVTLTVNRIACEVNGNPSASENRMTL